MTYRFTFKHMDTSDAIQNYAQTRFDRIEKYGLHKPGKIHFIFSVEKHEAKAEVLVDFGGAHVTAHAHHPDMYAAIDLVVEKVERQMLKVKGKKTSHRAISMAKEWAKKAFTFGRASSDE